MSGMKFRVLILHDATVLPAADGRFTRPDPALDMHTSDPTSFNMYAYVHDNPANLTDPSGGEGEVLYDTYFVKPGDSLSDAIAQRELGDPGAWRELAAHNPQLSDPDFIFPGNEIKIPRGSQAPVTRAIAWRRPSGERFSLLMLTWLHRY